MYDIEFWLQVARDWVESANFWSSYHSGLSAEGIARAQRGVVMALRNAIRYGFTGGKL